MAMKIHSDVISRDLKKCVKKHWYPGLEVEIKNVVKLLNINHSLPGESTMHGFKGKLAGRTYHARIALSDFSIGKRKGPRLAYYLPLDRNEECLVLYVGGHKDGIYDTAQFCDLITSRYLDSPTSYLDLEEFMST